MTSPVPHRDPGRPLGTNSDGRYRVLDESSTVEALLHHSFPVEVLSGAMRAALAREQTRLAVNRWVDRGLLRYRDAGRERRFDFVEVANAMALAGRDGDPYYHEGPIHTFRRAATELAQRPRDPDGLQRFEIHLTREFHFLPPPAEGTTARLRIPLPLEDDPSTREIVVELLRPDPATVSMTRGPGRLEVRVPVPRDGGRVAVEARIRLATSPVAVDLYPLAIQPWRADGPEFDLYTRASEGLIHVTPTIVSLGQSLAGSTENPWEFLNHCWRFFFERMALGRIHHDELDPADPLADLVSRGWFDCFAGSALLVALCRSRGIPARLVNGITLYASIPSNHYWAEVALLPFGWVPLDLACRELATGDFTDNPWAHYYFGRLDPRLTCQRFPRQIVGPIGVRVPPSWFLLPSTGPEGSRTTLLDLDTGATIYRDTIQVRPVTTR